MAPSAKRYLALRLPVTPYHVRQWRGTWSGWPLHCIQAERSVTLGGRVPGNDNIKRNLAHPSIPLLKHCLSTQTNSWQSTSPKTERFTLPTLQYDAVRDAAMPLGGQDDGSPVVVDSGCWADAASSCRIIRSRGQLRRVSPPGACLAKRPRGPQTCTTQI